MNMSQSELRRAVAMWGIAMCLLSAAIGWVFMRFGQAWSIADLPSSEYVAQIVPAYAVTEVAMIPVGGKLVDKYGCRPILGIAPFIYIVSSMLCIISPTVECLIVFRFFQGMGGGLILAVAFTCASKFYDMDKRAKCNELMTGAFALGSLFGTATGYFLTDNFNWRAGFVVFSAVMLIGFLIAWKFLPEEEVTGGKTDILGLVLVASVFGIATMYTQMVNVEFPLLSIQSLIFAIVLIVLTILLMRHSYHSDDPPVPTHNGYYHTIMTLLMFMFSLCGLGLIQYFFKLYLTYYEFDIYRASFMFLVMLGGAAITSMASSRFIYKTGARPWIVTGSAVVTIALMLTNLIADKGEVWMGVSLFIFGFGLGCIVTEILCAMQSIMPKADSGLHTCNLMAIRMIGIMIGSALIGSYINTVLENNRGEQIIDLTATDNLLSTLANQVLEGLKYVANTLDDGFLTTAVVLAMITSLLTVLAHTLGKDDIEAIEANKESKELEKIEIEDE